MFLSCTHHLCKIKQEILKWRANWSVWLFLRVYMREGTHVPRHVHQGQVKTHGKQFSPSARLVSETEVWFGSRCLYLLKPPRRHILALCPWNALFLLKHQGNCKFEGKVRIKSARPSHCGEDVGPVGLSLRITARPWSPCAYGVRFPLPWVLLHMGVDSFHSGCYMTSWLLNIRFLKINLGRCVHCVSTCRAVAHIYVWLV